MLKENYYFSTFFWSTLQKVLAALFGFLSVPLLLKYYGANNYGILSLATACNGYMHLLDLGMNVGAVRYFTLWWSEGNKDKVNRVAKTNITFYAIISLINIILLISLALFGKNLFSTTPDQFIQLQKCLFIIAFFCFFSWGATTFQQLLIAAKKMAYTAQVQIVQTICKILLVACVFVFDLSITVYFFILTFIIAALVFPYAIRCLRLGLIDSFLPATHWNEFRVVLTFSLSIFALSLFQMTASQSRPIILGLFSGQGPSINAEYRIIEVIPLLIIMMSSTLSTMFLPKTTELIHKNNAEETENFVYKWTILTTIVTCCLCFPFMLGANEIICAYVGTEYSYLSIWLICWVTTTLIQMHCTPAYSLVMAKGKTKMLVYISASSCILSIVINAILAPKLGLGSAIIGYAIYVTINMSLYYIVYYSRVLGLQKRKVFSSFIQPTIIAMLSVLFVFLLPITDLWVFPATRLGFICLFAIKSTIWVILFFVMLFATKTIKYKGRKVITKFD